MNDARAGTVAQPSDLVDVAHLVTAYYTGVPDPDNLDQQVAFGTSGHRGSSLRTAFNETHILATTQAIVDYRRSRGFDGPLFLGRDTHGLSEPAWASALEVLAANDVTVLVDDRDGYTPTPGVSHAILRANRAFLDMVQMGSETSLLGNPLGRWLGRPGADLTVLLANVLRLGAVRLFSTTLHGEHGTEVEVEISANGNTATSPAYIGVFLRDIGRRLSTEGQAGGVAQWLDFLTKQVGKTTLRKLVDDTVEVVERHYILAALELALTVQLPSAVG